ncbi:MAG: polysaccharide deacetylase family protein [Candidatus Helarchaeota archaeon]|nr:polysaccharide deacetylase family protein [Candidatus Helarchaeota archaeon]
MFRRILTYKNKIPVLIKKISNYLSLFSANMVSLIARMNRIFEKYDVKMTYFISTYLIENQPTFFSHFGDHDYGPHGHTHPDYSLIGRKAAFKDMREAISVFKKFNQNPWIFRAPYGITRIEKNSDLFFEYEKKLGILYDTSINIQKPPWKEPPHPIKHKSGVITLPLIGVSDDVLIDNLGLNNNNVILRHFVEALDYGRTGVLVYDLHPIRMGQVKYVEILEGFIKIINKKKNFMILSLKEAFSKFYKKDKEETIVCLSGDIDNLSILDYFRRLKT